MTAGPYEHAWIDLEGAANVRDVAGLPTVDGRRVRPGVLLRADNLQGLTEVDVAHLVDERRLRTVIDLRTTGEVHLEGAGPLVGRVDHHHLTLIPEVPGEPDEVEVDRAVPSFGDDDRAGRRGERSTDMTGYYVGYVEDAPTNLAQALRLLADAGNGTTVVHCAAGKDRTGTVVALALSLAGVRRDAVVADYVASAERIDGVLARLQASRTYGEDLATQVGFMLRTSDNDAAEVLHRMVAVQTGYPATWEGAAEAQVAALSTLGVTIGHGRVHDGSGLSRADRLSPAEVVAVLSLPFADTRPNLASLRSGSLAVAGVTGTLGPAYLRYRSGPTSCAQGLIEAKTGSLSGVIALSGRAVGADGRVKLFSFLLNRVPSTLATRRAVDKLATTVTGCW